MSVCTRFQCQFYKRVVLFSKLTTRQQMRRTKPNLELLKPFCGKMNSPYWTIMDFQWFYCDSWRAMPRTIFWLWLFFRESRMIHQDSSENWIREFDVFLRRVNKLCHTLDCSSIGIARNWDSNVIETCNWKKVPNIRRRSLSKWPNVFAMKFIRNNEQKYSGAGYVQLIIFLVISFPRIVCIKKWADVVAGRTKLIVYYCSR